MKLERIDFRLLAILGVGSLVPYLGALGLQDLRQHTVEFEILFWAAFVLYAATTVVAVRMKAFPRRVILASFVLAAAMQGLLLFTSPTLSDDMYRYVWDGRVQAHGISPYDYPPAAPELEALRDSEIWPSINRPAAVTIYPPGAEIAYALLWRAAPDSVRGFQAALAAGGLAAGVVLLGLLRALDRSPARLLIYLWSPLLAFETAHGAHVDGLVLPLLVGAWWARVRERDGLVGVLLGLATAVKLYPALLFPALWRPDDRRGRWRMPAAFVLTVGACYLPYVVRSGARVLGYLPQYLGERFNVGLAGALIPLFQRLGIDPDHGLFLLMAGILAAMTLVMVLRPAASGEDAVRRSIWLIAGFTLLAQDLFSWYVLWALPLVALFLRPGRAGLRADGWTGWWLFCGLVGLSYTFFIEWRPVTASLWIQFLPLYGLLLWDGGRRLWQRCRRGETIDEASPA